MMTLEGGRNDRRGCNGKPDSTKPDGCDGLVFQGFDSVRIVP